MANLLAHALLALTIMSALDLLLGLPPVSTGSFIAAAVAVLVDLDYSGNHCRSPLTHSVIFAFVWCSLAACFAVLVSQNPGTTFVVPMFTGYLSHLGIDSATEGGIFLFPRKKAPLLWFKMHAFRPYVAGGEVKTSVIMWPAWLRIELRPFRKRIANEAGGLNAMICVVCIVSLIVLVYLMP